MSPRMGYNGGSLYRYFFYVCVYFLSQFWELENNVLPLYNHRARCSWADIFWLKSWQLIEIKILILSQTNSSEANTNIIYSILLILKLYDSNDILLRVAHWISFLSNILIEYLTKSIEYYIVALKVYMLYLRVLYDLY